MPCGEFPQQSGRAHPRSAHTGPRSHPGADRRAHTAHPRLRPTVRNDLQGALPRNRAPATGRGGRTTYSAHLRAHSGRSLPLRKEPQRGRLSKEGDELLRRLLVSCAHYILGPFGSDSDLRRHGEKIAARGAKNSKKRAVVAVARKLAVLLHSLWISAEVYEPLRNTQRSSGGQAA